MCSMKLELNQLYEVKSLNENAQVSRRLFELGFTKGQKFKLVGRSIFGEPFIVQLNHTKVSLRNSELSCIEVCS